MRALAFSGGKDSMACLHMCRDKIDFAIFVDTGKTYPETWDMVDYARTMVPVFIAYSNQDEQNKQRGIPSDVVPIDYTILGQAFTKPKPFKVQSYLECCFQNISLPLFMKARELGASSIIYGQRIEDGRKSPARNGDMVEGIMRLHPIENWNSDQVLDYLSTVMDVPAHYSLKYSSLDCYDCTAFRKESQDRIAYTREKYPEYYKEYETRMHLVRKALLDTGHMEVNNGA